MDLKKEKVQEFSKKYKKALEKVEVNPYAYFIDGIPYNFVLYKSKLLGSEKGYAIISPKNNEDINKVPEAFAAQIKFVITKNNIEDGKNRIEVHLASHEEVKNYLNQVLKGCTLETKQKDIYLRAFKTLDQMFKLQEEFNTVWQDAHNQAFAIVNKGYFNESDLDKILMYPPRLNVIQYKQLQLRYINREDFDLIYEDRHNIIGSKKLINYQVLKGMTTKYVNQELERSIKTLTNNVSINSLDTYEDIEQKWFNSYKNILEERIENEINYLRYPDINGL